MHTEDDTPVDDTIEQDAKQDTSSDTDNLDTAAEDTGGEEKAETINDAISQALKSSEGEDDDKPAAKEPEAKTANEEKETEPKPLSEDELLQVPEDTKPATAQRMHQLIDTIKEKDSVLTQQKQMLTGFQKMIHEASGSAEEFNELIGFARNMRGNTEAKRQALNYLNAQRNALALELGETNFDFDPLAEHADLRKAVDDMEISEQYALEIARNRQSHQRSEQQRQRQQQAQDNQRKEQQDRNEYQTRVNQGTAAIDSLVSKWQNEDIDWAAKEPFILKEAQRIASTMQPEQWEYAMELAYKAAATQKPAARNPNALRPMGGGTVSKKPSNMMEAVSNALGE